MKFEEHCRESLRLFGKQYKEVHQWLDKFAGNEKYGMKHRKLRHHEKGIKDVEVIFGKEAGKAARKHIISDLKEEGWSESDPFPKDEKDYVRMGFY